MNRLDFVDSYGDVIKVKPVINIYGDENNLYVGLTSYDEDLEEEDLYCSLTVNGSALPFLHGAIDTTYNGDGKIKFLEEQGFGEFTGKYVPYGGSLFPVFRFKEEKLREINPDVFSEYAGMHAYSIKKENQENSLDEKIARAKEMQQGKRSNEKSEGELKREKFDKEI